MDSGAGLGVEWDERIVGDTDTWFGVDLAVGVEEGLCCGFGMGDDPVLDVYVGDSENIDPGLDDDCEVGLGVVDCTESDPLGDGTGVSGFEGVLNVVDADPGLEAFVGCVRVRDGNGGGGGIESDGLSGSNLHEPKQLEKFSVALLMITRRVNLIAIPHSVCDTLICCAPS